MSVKRLVALNAVTLSSDPASPRLGDIYFNTVVSQLKYYDGTTWIIIPAGLLNHVHTYDGAIFSVDSYTVPDAGIIDGGTP